MRLSLAALLCFCTLALGPPSAWAQVLINEVRTDQPGSDDPNEYIELAGSPGTSLDGLTLVVIGDLFLDPNTGVGGSGAIEEVIPLDGNFINTFGYFVVAESTLTLGDADLVDPDLRLENNDNITIFLVSDYTGPASGGPEIPAEEKDLDTDNDGLLDLEPWNLVLDRIAIIESDNPPVEPDQDYHYGPPTVGPNGVFSPGHVYRCSDSSASGTFRIGDFDPVAGQDTVGFKNDCPTVMEPDAGMLDDAGGMEPPAPDAGAAPDGGTTTLPPDLPVSRRARPGIFCGVSPGTSPAGLLPLFLALLFVRRGRRS